MKIFILAIFFSISFKYAIAVSVSKIVKKAYLYSLLSYNLKNNDVNEIFQEYLIDEDENILLNYIKLQKSIKLIKIKSYKNNSKIESSFNCIDEIERINNLNLQNKQFIQLLTILSENNQINKKNIKRIYTNNYELELIRLWCYIDYFYPYRCEFENWEKILEKAEKILNKTSHLEKNFYIAVKYIASNINDRHTLIDKFIDGKQQHIAVDSNFLSQKILPFTLSFNNKTIVIERSVLESNLDLIGKKIKTINNEPPFYFLDTIRFNKQIVLNEDIILISDSKTALINVEETDKQVQNINIRKLSLFLNNSRSNMNYKYPYFDIFSEEILIDDIFLTLDTIILDMRGYPKSNFVEKNINYFYDSCYINEIVPHKNKPGSFYIKKGYFKKGNLTNKKQIIFVLVNSFTGSYSEHLCMVLKTNPNVFFVGSQTSNSFGVYDNYNNFYLTDNIIFNTTKTGLLFNKSIPYSYLGQPFDVLPVKIIKSKIKI